MENPLDREWCVPAPAKINLFLHITGVREDGYHNLQTVFQLLDIADEIRLQRRVDGIINRTRGLIGLNQADDLVVKAATALQNASGVTWGADICVNKQLPVGGGIGGGSSDAASTLVALNKLWECQLSESDLMTIGRQLGADVPVFIRGKNAWAEGIGDLLTGIDLPPKWYLLIHPQVHISTAQLFSSDELTRDMPLLRIRDFPDTDTSNVFEDVARKCYPEVDSALRWLSDYSQAKLTGTGSCIFAPFSSQEEALGVSKQVPKRWKSYVCQSVSHSPLIDATSKISAA